MNENKKSGARHQIIVLEVKRDKNAGKTELIRLQEYFKRENQNYSFVLSVYGSPKNAAIKMIEEELKQGVIAHPDLFLFEVNQLLIRLKKISSAGVIAIAAVNTFQEFGEKYFPVKSKEGESHDRRYAVPEAVKDVHGAGHSQG